MASIHRDRDAWRVRWRDASGRQHSQTFTRKADATAHAAIVEADRHRGLGIDPQGGRISFDTYAAEWQARQVWRDSTATSMRQILSGLPFGHRPLAGIRYRDIQGWVADMSDRLAPATVEQRYRAAVAVFRAAKRDRLISDLPTDDVRLPSKARTPSERAVALDPEAVAELLAALPGPGTTWTDYARVILLTGLRPSEAAGITSDRITGGILTVDRQLDRGGTGLVPPKTPASVRQIPLSDAALAVLESRPVASDGLLFVNRHRRPLSQSTRTGAWHKAAAVLAADGHPLPTAARGWHTLRHTFASTALAAGMDPATLSRFLGHATVDETLRTYSHAIPGALEAHRNTVATALNL